VIEKLEISSTCTSGVRLQLEGVKGAGGCPLWLDSAWIEAIKVEEPTPQYLPRRGELVNYTGGSKPQKFIVKKCVHTSEGWKIHLVGLNYLVNPAWVFPIKTETEEKPQTMTDSTSNQVKWIPVDAENLPEGVVLAISKEGMMYLSTLRLVSDVPIINEDESPTFVVGAGYIPLEELRQLWDEQNPAARYSKESEAYNILERALLDADPSFNHIFEEISSEATSTIDFLAWEMLSRFNGSGVLHREVVYWIKDYIKSLN
jgi:hypothetical protein